jgi:signal transduction histidine kinase/FixJ family two-component response regulator
MNETLLLVDDEEGIRNVLKISLMDSGYSVITAASVDEALIRFEEKRPDIILTDIKMPGRTGIDLLKIIKEMDRDVEVIMLTGHGDLDLAIQSLKLEAADFLTKPINDDVLGHALNRATERIKMRRSLREYAENLEAMVRDQSARLVEAERQLATLQVMEGLSAGFASLSNSLANEGTQPVGDEGTQPSDDLFNLLPCFVSVHNSQQKIVAVNRLFRERLGDLAGASSAAAYAPECMPDPNACPVGRVLGMGVGQRANETLVDKQGRNLPVSIYAVPIYNNEGDVELVLELAVDSSEARRLREELRHTRERFRQLFEESPSYAVVVDRTMRIVEANRRFRSDFGPPEGRCHELYMHRQSACPDCPASRSFADGLTHQWESVVAAKDGRKVNVLVVTAPLHDADGNIAEVMELSTDITELRSLQDHLSQLGLLLGSTAHGIKGLLTALDGSVYRMGSGLKQNNAERVEDGFRDMRLLIGRMRKMVLDILYYSKNRTLAWEEVPVAAFAAEIFALIEEKAAEQGVRLVHEFVADNGGNDLGMMEADAGAVSSALVNILENAVEACAANSHPPPEGRRVTFTVRGDAEQACFIVADTGIGMDREAREKLFTLFFSSKGSAGTGIGLYIAGQVVRQHGGSITVESEPGKGAVFTITLRRRLPDAVRDASTPLD